MEAAAGTLAQGWRRSAAALSWGVALAATAIGVRLLLTPWLGDRLFFVFAYPAVVAAAVIFSPLAGAWVAVLCAFAWWLPGLSPGPAGMTVLDSGVFLSGSMLAAWLVGWSQSRRGADAPAESASPRSALAWLRVIGAAALVLPAIFFALVAHDAYHRTLSAGQTRVARAAQIVEVHAARAAETNESIRAHIDELTRGRSSAALKADEARLHASLRDIAARHPQVQSIWLWDEDGNPVVGSIRYPAPGGLNVADREYFVAHRTMRGADLFITGPLVSRSTGERFFDFAYRRRAPDGRFAGVLSISLRPEYFADHYRELVRTEPGLILVLARPDGTIITRYPPSPVPQALAASSPWLKAMREGVAQGDLELVSSLDGERRFISYRALANAPLYASAGVARSIMLGSWYAETGRLAAFIVPLSLGLVLLTQLASRRTLRALAASEALGNEARRRLAVENALQSSQRIEALGRLTGGVAHDFNNLLAVLSNNQRIHELRHPQLADETENVAIRRAIASGTHLTRKLLSFSRLQPQRQEVVSLEERLPAIADLVRSSLKPSVRLDVRITLVDAWIRVDPQELELALINLAVNADAAMPNGGTLSFSLRAMSSDAAAGDVAPPPCAELVVADTGVGMTEEVQARAFEPFFTTKAPGHGTGLGLSQVWGTCSSAGGRVTLQSRPGVGTTFSLIFPLVPAPPAQAQPAEDSLQPLPFGRVLLVEDNDEIRRSTAKLFRTLGTEVETAASGEAALERLSAGEKFELVLSDVMMPGMSGIALARTLQSRPDSPAVVLTTGYTESLAEARALGLDVLSKPCSPQDLLAALRRALRRRDGASGA